MNAKEKKQLPGLASLPIVCSIAWVEPRNTAGLFRRQTAANRECQSRTAYDHPAHEDLHGRPGIRLPVLLCWKTPRSFGPAGSPGHGICVRRHLRPQDNLCCECVLPKGSPGSVGETTWSPAQ